jgi:hypothetical protein
MKGIELPINVLIIIAVAIIVLIAVVAMFYSPVNTSGNSVSLDVAKSQACRSLVIGYNCNNAGTSSPADATTLGSIRVDNYDVDGLLGPNSVGDTLMYLCVKKYMVGAADAAGAASCRKLCGCAE